MSIPFGRPMIGDAERAAVSDVLDGSTLTHGPRVREFERAFEGFTGAEHAVAVNSCMAALHLAYMAIDLGPGDEVIVPAQTHVAMAHAVEACGGTPVFVDAEPRTGNLDLEQLEDRIGERTRAISVVHFLGLPVEMGRVLDLARRHDLLVVEDCAIALGATLDGVHVGLHGDVGCFSFYPVKHITTGEGGMAITTRADLAERISKQRAFGIDKSVVADRRHSAAYDVDVLGLNYRLGEIPAALGLVQMERLPGFLAAREQNYAQLWDGLSQLDELELIDSRGGGARRSSHYCLSALLTPDLANRREQVIEGLKARGIGTSVYYPKPLPETSHYRRAQGARDQVPNASRISSDSVAFPVGPHLGGDDVETMISATREVLDEVRKNNG